MQRIGKILDRDSKFTRTNHLKNSTFQNHPQGIKDVGIFFFYYLYTRVCPELLTSPDLSMGSSKVQLLLLLVLLLAIQISRLWTVGEMRNVTPKQTTKTQTIYRLGAVTIKNTLFGQKHMIRSAPCWYVFSCDAPSQHAEV